MAAPVTCHKELLAKELGDYGPDYLATCPLCVMRGGLAPLETAILSCHTSDPNAMASGDIKVPENRCCLDIKPIGVSGGILTRDTRLDVVCECGTLYYAAVLEMSRKAGDEDIGGNPRDGRHLKELINGLVIQFNIDSLEHPKLQKNKSKLN